MIFSIYSIKDQFTGFLTPSFDQNDSSAKRNFSFALGRSDLLLGSFPQHYDLYCLGTFDSDTGCIVPISPELVCSGSYLLKQKGVVGSD